MEENRSISEAVWAEILAHVRAHHPAISRGWFSQLYGGPLVGGELSVFTRSAAQLVYLQEHCVRPFVEAAQAGTNRLVSVSFKLEGDDANLRGISPAPGIGPNSFSPLRLNGDYVFENFVVGPCNRLAHASCIAVSESPGTVYNPLFVHGSVGLGKTHLLQAVCHKVYDHSPAARIEFLSCESFVNSFIEAVEKGALEQFRYRYRHVDLLIIDDIQFLSGRERTQEEFFHTFNTLYQLHKQIILSADCPPAQIPSLEERLVSRFNWGLVVRIDPPCLETRVAIIRKKTSLRGMTMPEDVMLFIAARIKSNIRELEGALNRLHGISTLDGRAVDMNMVKASLGEINPELPRPVRLQEILGVVTDRFDVKMSELKGRCRSRSIALPRQVCMYLARQFTGHSLEEIGGFFGGRDHSTVLHANRLIAQRRQDDAAFRLRISEIEETLRRGP